MNFFIDCDGVLNSQSKVRKYYIPDDSNPGDWSEWHNRFEMEQPNVAGMKMINQLIGKSDRISLLSLRHTGLEKRTREYILDYKLLPRLKLEDIHFCPPDIRGAGEQFKASVLKGFSQGIQPYIRGKASKQITFIDDSIRNIVAAQEIVTCLYYPTFKGL